MGNKFELTKSYIVNLGYDIISEDPDDEIVVVANENNGVLNLVVDCEDPILIFEQFIGIIKNDSKETYKRLMQINRELVHGAFVLDSEENRLLFRDTLQLENLDENEVEGTLSALGLAMAEYGNELIEICK
ncbi:MAG: YbjN domain-containing protein [Candidatus Marinimicrobia bacterium]|nr:YbjN domain-containing protein [Candidatus Neomarinimicrobiota bacterium]MCH8068765.1 YbjN domain-containing protein [Candidatus Neomarinimicrobiota bacterium]